MCEDCNCPYCGEPQEINHDDGYGYEEGETYQQTCSDCGKTFVYTTAISFSYSPDKADCLNGAPHEWKPSMTWPRYATKMVCSMCDERRAPTEAERKQYNIPTRSEEYPDEVKKEAA